MTGVQTCALPIYITTSYGLGGAIPFGLELVRQLVGPDEAARVQKAIAYKHSLLYKTHR